MWSRLKRALGKALGAIDGPPPYYPPTGLSTVEQWDRLPAIKKALQWDAEGQLWVHEIKRCPATGLEVRITREVKG